MAESVATSMLPPDTATCLGCGYSLRELTNRTCPECGRGFDPNDPLSMSVPGAPSPWEARVLAPQRWRHRAVRNTLIAIALVSTWFMPPHPLPALAVIAVWLCSAVPHHVRMIARRVIVARYGLPTTLIYVDDPEVRRARRMLYTALMVVGLHLPFIAAFAVSYPFLARSAWYWWAVAPSNVDPPKHPTLRGLLPVTSIDAEASHVSFHLIGGEVYFVPNEDGKGMSVGLHFDPWYGRRRWR